GQAEDFLQGARAAVEKSEMVKEGLPAFDAEWNKASLELAASDKSARERAWHRMPAGARAISEAAQARAPPLLEGSRGFATATPPKDGLFYMGQSKGEAEFAAFVYGLHMPRKGAELPLRSLLPELQALQEKTNAAFQPPRSIEMHPRFIALNSTLKFA